MDKMRLLLTIFIVLSIGRLHAQENPLSDTTSITKKDIQEIKNELDSLNDKLDKLTTKTIKFGVSIGFRRLRAQFEDDYHSASISPIDSTLQLDRLSTDAVILSTSVVFSPFVKSKWIKNVLGEFEDDKKNIKNTIACKRTFKRLDKLSEHATGLGRDRLNRTGVTFKQMAIQFISNIGIQANINLVDFTEGQENYSFNKSIEGGLGLSYRLSENIFVSMHYDLFFTRQLRNNIKQRSDQRIYNTDGSPITDIGQIDIDNDNFYITKSMSGLAYRIIVVF